MIYVAEIQRNQSRTFIRMLPSYQANLLLYIVVATNCSNISITLSLLYNKTLYPLTKYS